MNNDDEEQPGKIKVIDRRRFDPDGNAKDNSQGSTDRSPPISNGNAQVEKKISSNKKEDPVAVVSPDHQSGSHALENDSPEIDFSGFVMSMATQALMALGEIKPPDGMNVPKDMGLAQQTIEILAMLENKTKGNLDSKEKELMQNILHSLRLAYVKGRTK